MNAKQFEKAVRARCIEVQKYGYKIVQHGFGVTYDYRVCKFMSYNKKVCPIGACLLNSSFNKDNYATPIRAAIFYLEITQAQLDEFTTVFDGEKSIYGGNFYEVGKRLRKEFIK